MITTHRHGEKGYQAHHPVADYTAAHTTTYPAVPALQRKSTEDEELQLKSVTQLATPEEDELQMKSAGPLRDNTPGGVSQRKDNEVPLNASHTGMPDQLKSGIENLSGYSMDDVKVHYNSAKPAQLNALAYAQGSDIHIAPGQERHLPHEAWHVVQQKQGRVKPTLQAKGVSINDDRGLEKEADVMGEKAIQAKADGGNGFEHKLRALNADHGIVQAKKTAPFNVDRKYAAKVADYSEYKDLDQQAYNKFIYDKLSAIYDVNLNKGTGYWDKLKKAIVSFEAEDNTEFLKRQNEKHAEYNLKFNKNYFSETKPKKDSESIEILSWGLASDSKKARVKRQQPPYQNIANFEDNSITAKHNYAEQDMARKQDVEMSGDEDYKKRGLPNSEILWQQYKLAAKSQFRHHKDSRARELVKGLSTIKRREVQNASTLMTILFALPDDKTDFQTPHTWQAESEEFEAMLGTPNCSGAAFLLADHVDELDGKSITEIELLGGRDVNLDIKIG